MGEYGSATPWNDSSVRGVKRFLDRVAGLTDMAQGEGATPKLESAFHKTVKKVSQDIEDMKFNTAIAAMMALINDIYDAGTLTRDELGVFVRILCPFAPHIAEEIWEMLGHDDFAARAEWPEWDEAKTIDATVTYAVQVNGKLRATLDLPKDMDKDSAIAAAKAEAKVVQFTEGKTVVKEIFVPGKIINIVVK